VWGLQEQLHALLRLSWHEFAAKRIDLPRHWARCRRSSFCLVELDIAIFLWSEWPLSMKADTRGAARNYSQSDSDNTSASPPIADVGSIW